MDKRCKDLVEAVDPIKDGARIMIGGFGSSGIPFGLIDALLGNYYGVNPNIVTFLEGITDKVAINSQVQYSPGTTLDKPNLK